MTAGEIAPLRRLALAAIRHGAESGTDAKTLATATHGAYDDLARVLAPLVGDVGVTTLTMRALHVTQREYPWLAEMRDLATDEPISQLEFSLARHQDTTVAAEAAAAMLASLLALLVTFIGKPLTMSLVRRAWPHVSSDFGTKDTRT